MEKTKICEAFGRAATSYDMLASFQRKTCEQMLCLLPEWLPDGLRPTSLLDAGCGTGFGAQCMRCLWPNERLVGCDISEEMVRCARAKGFDAVTGDLENLPFEGAQFDFIWSSLAIQWCSQEKVFAGFRRVLKKGGAVYFTTLAPGSLPEIAHAFSEVDETPHVIALTSLEALRDIVKTSGLTDVKLRQETVRMHYPDVRSALESVRGIGAGHVSGKRKSMLGKTAWQNIQRRYESLGEDGGIPVTYEVIFGMATNNG